MTNTGIQIQEQYIKRQRKVVGLLRAQARLEYAEIRLAEAHKKARIRQGIRALETALLTRSEAERNELIEFAQSLLKGAA
ncbi:hypothetical protein [Pseudomonas oryzihabitans]|uniref:hypothetical protein n=1 Tax=Pseudomonas oryzihabitans TaxID=47885 RepID=UPI00241C17D5|nr:hypothetical protein [Pseudomonas oryzihabitans]